MIEPIEQLSDSEQVSAIIDRRNDARKYVADIWEELKEVYRGIKVRTKARRRYNVDTGKYEEDRTTTNVAMPDLNIMWRRNVAKYTGAPYRLRYIGSSIPYVAEALSALAVQQYDRSREAFHDRRVVAMAEAFGFGYSKVYFDKLSFDMNMRRALVRDGQVVYRDRASIMKAQGAPEPEIAQAVEELGPQLTDAEASAFIGKVGNDVIIQEQVKSYEGPCVKSVFSGALYLQPNCLSLYESDFAIEEYQETDVWLKAQCEKTYRDRETDEIMPVMDIKAVEALIAADPEPNALTQAQSLRTMLDDAIGRPVPITPKRLRVRRRYDILEQHALGEDGRMWITWIAENYRDRPLGRMPYEFDLYGDFAYSELVPLPDMISAYGDCTPRLLRWLYEMHNRTVAQNFDYVADLIKKILIVKDGKALSNPIDMGHFKKVNFEGSPQSDLMYLQPPPLPNGSFEREAQIMRMESMAEPNMTNVDNGTAANPQAGKTATTAVLSAKASDALTAFKLDGRDLYLRSVGQKKLYINQQAQHTDEPWAIGDKAWTPALRGMVQKGQLPKHAFSERNGKVVSVNLDVLDIQEQLTVEPEAGSYLAVDDQLRQQAAMDLHAVAAASPGIIDQRKVAEFQLSTIRGIGDPKDYILPPTPPQPTDEFRKNLGVNVTAKFEDLPAPLQNQILQGAGLGNPATASELQARDTTKGVKELSGAADAAANLASPAVPPLDPAKPGGVPQPSDGKKISDIAATRV